jgi:uncharacterized protein YjiS (DUF1127 family)
MPPQLTNISSEIEGDAAGRGLSLPIVLSLIRRYWRALQEQRRRVTLQDLSDRELMDIGLTRGEIDYFTPERAIDRLRDGTAHLWSRGGM